MNQDELGRVRAPCAQREAILDPFDASGMSGTAFAAYAGVKYPTFANWVQQRRRERVKMDGSADSTSERGAGAARWIEVVTGALAPLPLAPVAVHLPGGARIELRDVGGVALAAELIGKLAGVRGC